MLILSNISKRFPTDDDNLFKDVSFTLNAGECTAIIGANGSGKSTLIKIIMGIESPTTGSVSFQPANLRIGYLSQGTLIHDKQTIQQVLFPQYQAILEAEERLQALSEDLSDGDAYDKALDHLIRLSDTLDEQAGHRALLELGLGNISLDTRVNILSGGQKTRLILAQLIASNPQLLILDEPTNHLDIEALAWLETWLTSFKGGILIVSHDRQFIDRLAQRVIVLETETDTVRMYAGNYSAYLEQEETELRKQFMLWKDQEVEIERLKADVSRTMAKAVNRENATVNDFQRGRAKKVAKNAQAKAQRLEKYLSSDDRVDKPSQHWDINLNFLTTHPVHGQALQLKNLSIGYDKDHVLIDGIHLSVGGQDRVAIVGGNGSGKTTLIKTLLKVIQPITGIIITSTSAQIGYLSQEQNTLNLTDTPLETIQAITGLSESQTRTFLHQFLFSGDDALRPIKLLSHGERTRLMLAQLIASGANLLIMDEPLNHLDIASKEKFEQALMNYNGAIISVVHDRYFVERFANKIWAIEEQTIKEVLSI
jgi:ATP-binding cassette subfamily F protein 3